MPTQTHGFYTVQCGTRRKERRAQLNSTCIDFFVQRSAILYVSRFTSSSAVNLWASRAFCALLIQFCASHAFFYLSCISMLLIHLGALCASLRRLCIEPCKQRATTVSRPHDTVLLAKQLSTINDRSLFRIEHALSGRE